MVHGPLKPTSWARFSAAGLGTRAEPLQIIPNEVIDPTRALDHLVGDPGDVTYSDRLRQVQIQTWGATPFAGWVSSIHMVTSLLDLVRGAKQAGTPGPSV